MLKCLLYVSAILFLILFMLVCVAGIYMARQFFRGEQESDLRTGRKVRRSPPAWFHPAQDPLLNVWAGATQSWPSHFHCEEALLGVPFPS
jgi:hypothetical protein